MHSAFCGQSCLGLLTDGLGLGPGGLLGVAEDHPEGDIEPGGTAVARRLGADRGDGLAGLGQGFAPEREDIGVLAGHPQGGGRGTAEIDRQARLLQRLDGGEALRHPVVLALVIEGLGAGPLLAHHVEELLGAGVALIVVEPVTVLALL